MTPGATGSTPTGRPAHFPGHPLPEERLCHDSKQDGITESHEDRFQQVTSLKPSSYDAPTTWFPLRTPVSRSVAVPVWSATSQRDGGPPALLGAPARSPCCVSRTCPGYDALESSVTVSRAQHSVWGCGAADVMRVQWRGAESIKVPVSSHQVLPLQLRPQGLRLLTANTCLSTLTTPRLHPPAADLPSPGHQLPLDTLPVTLHSQQHDNQVQPVVLAIKLKTKSKIQNNSF